MSTRLVDGASRSFLGNLLGRAECAIVRWREVRALDKQEINQIARDVNLSPAELVTLMTVSPDSLLLLKTRLAYEGLSQEQLAASHTDEPRDLWRVCSLCIGKARCARDIRHNRMAAPSKYCPNEPTVRMLASEAHNEPVARAVHFPIQRT